MERIEVANETVLRLSRNDKSDQGISLSFRTLNRGVRLIRRQPTSSGMFVEAYGSCPNLMPMQHPCEFGFTKSLDSWGLRKLRRKAFVRCSLLQRVGRRRSASPTSMALRSQLRSVDSSRILKTKVSSSVVPRMARSESPWRWVSICTSRSAQIKGSFTVTRWCLGVSRIRLAVGAATAIDFRFRKLSCMKSVEIFIACQ